MNKIENVVTEVAKNLKMNTEGIETFGGRWVLTDTFTTIMAAEEGTDISLWAVTHKRFVDENWEKIKAGTFLPQNPYQEVINDKLSRCDRKPEVEIIYETNMDGVEVVVYTDTIDAMVLEASTLRKEDA